jgi:hypothetical protein
MRRTSPFVAIVVGRRRLRFRFDDFLVRIWLLYAFIRRTFPVPVIEKRFLAPLWVFIFGMTNSRATVIRRTGGSSVKAPLLRRENHRHRLPFHGWRALDLR